MTSVTYHWYAASQQEPKLEELKNLCKSIHEVISGPGLAPDELLNLDGSWSLSIGDGLVENCFHDVNLEAAGKLEPAQMKEAVILFALRGIVPVSLADEEGNEVPFKSMKDVVEIFGEEASFFAEKIGAWKPMTVVNANHQSEQLFF